MIKDGIFENTWIEIKGWKTKISMDKFVWFCSEHKNTKLWDQSKLEELKILVKGKPNKEYENENCTY